MDTPKGSFCFFFEDHLIRPGRAVTASFVVVALELLG
jgi:hypothetical protein